MNIVRKSYWLGALLAATCVFSACTSNDDANEENTVSSNYIVVSSKVSMSGNSQAATVEVTSNCHWKVSYEKGNWADLIVTPTEGTGNTVVTIESSVNNTESDRVVVLNFSADDGSLPRACTVTQSAGDFQAELEFENLEGEKFTSSYEETTKSITIKSNTTWEADVIFETEEEDRNPWCYLADEKGSGNGHFTIVVTDNQTSSKRSAVIRVATSNKSGQQKFISMIVEQNAAPLPTATIEGTVGEGEDGVTISINGKVSSGSKYNLTDYGYCISRDPKPREKKSMLLEGSVKETTFSTTSKQEDGYTYYICAYATTVVGTTYSEDYPVTLPGSTPGNDDNPSPNLTR
jgi:hypothetical protein